MRERSSPKKTLLSGAWMLTNAVLVEVSGDTSITRVEPVKEME